MFVYSILFDLQLAPLASSVSQIMKELCFSSSYSFHFRHLSFNGIMKKAISSQNITNPIDFSPQDIFRSNRFSPKRLKTCSLVTFCDHIIFSILLQDISKLSKYFRSYFHSVQVSEPYEAMLQT